MKSGTELIYDERREQIYKHRRTVAEDKKQNKKRQLRSAAYMLIGDNAYIQDPPEGWNPLVWDKMKRKPIKERLVIAGALIAAELDRMNDVDPPEDIDEMYYIK